MDEFTSLALEAAREARDSIGIALDHYRDAVADALQAGCSVQEVADALDVSTNTIKQALRARALYAESFSCFSPRTAS